MHRFLPVSVAAQRLIILTCLSGVAACSYLPVHDFPASIKPHRSEIVQGNFVSSEQVATLRVGMPRAQVQNILGTPALIDIFHANRWDYVFSIKREGLLFKALRLTVHFKGDQLAQWEGDEMPSEAQFVQALTSDRRIGKIPPLMASEQDLAEFSARENRKLNNSPPAQAATAVANKVYPPLEPQ